MDNVPDSAMYFVSGIVFLATGAILFYVGGPPPRGSSPITKGFILLIVIVILNYFIFANKDRYKKIVDYYNSKYMGRVPWILYFVVPMCYIFLMWMLGRIHDHYGEYYRINGLK